MYPEKEDFTWKRRLLTGVKPGQTIAMVCTGDFHIFNKITEEEECSGGPERRTVGREAHVFGALIRDRLQNRKRSFF